MFIAVLCMRPRHGNNRSVLSRGPDTEDVVPIHCGILLSHEKDKTLPFVTTWMGLESIMLSKMSEVGKVKNCMISPMCGKY